MGKKNLKNVETYFEEKYPFCDGNTNGKKCIIEHVFFFI